MAEKQTIIGRMTQLVKANINSLLDRAESPEKMLDQLIRDYTNSIAEAENAVAQTIGNLRLAEKDYAEDEAAANEYGTKAKAASDRAEQLRAAGDTAGAEKFDNLAKLALTRQISYEQDMKQAEPLLASQRQVVEQLKDGLTQMRTKLADLKNRRDQLVAREKTAQAQAQVSEAAAKINVMDPTSELSRYEEKVRRTEALAAGKLEVANAASEDPFAELDNLGADAEVEARLAALKKQQ